MKQTSRTALLVIDMQNALVNGAFLKNETVSNINLAINKARDADVPIIFIQHNHASFAPMMQSNTGWELHPDLARVTDDLVIEKQASDAFYRTDLEPRLRELESDLLVLCGMQTEYCVDATCRSALSKDFDVVLIADGHTTGGGHLSAENIIAHHNMLLPNLAHPSASLSTIRARDLNFEHLAAET